MISDKPYISESAKINSKIAGECQDKTKIVFFYWLGYFNGQSSIFEQEENKK
ncbi:hypothetical protein QIT55_gp37 [Nitrosopumilus spindle-shaped virus]|uniref:Uncharacterized protein n=1 Tax=Nitrosopumilus spindle-shaped virus 1 TaxID=2848002 RepID=A0A514K313_9VIRU|nr:hypothetical protein QIT55_gp37 [Nitrosopumilus spindle-shaped virus]QDI74023.1 hypothetical protein [Nitrosopumilus spindle-shaped virus]